MRHHPAGPNRGSPARLVRWPWRVARTIRHGGPSRVVPMRQPRITGYGGRCACCVITRARRSTPKAVGRVSPTTHHAREILKGQPSGGHAEQAYKHRARDAGGYGGLAALLANKPVAPARKAHPPGTRPGRLGVVRCRGPWVQCDPGVPRALILFREQAMRTRTTGEPGARQTIRAAERWLRRIAPGNTARTTVVHLSRKLFGLGERLIGRVVALLLIGLDQPVEPAGRGNTRHGS